MKRFITLALVLIWSASAPIAYGQSVGPIGKLPIGSGAMQNYAVTNTQSIGITLYRSSPVETYWWRNGEYAPTNEIDLVTAAGQLLSDLVTIAEQQDPSSQFVWTIQTFDQNSHLLLSFEKAFTLVQNNTVWSVPLEARAIAFTNSEPNLPVVVPGITRAQFNVMDTNGVTIAIYDTSYFLYSGWIDPVTETLYLPVGIGAGTNGYVRFTTASGTNSDYNLNTGNQIFRRSQIQKDSYGLKLNISGLPGQGVTIQTSENFQTWTNWISVANPNGDCTVEDSPTNSKLFYRLLY